MKNYLITTLLVALFIIGCNSNESQSLKDPKLVREITEILDAIEKEPTGKRFLGHPKTLISSGFEPTYNIIAQETEARILIANPDTSLPIMFERFEKIPKTSAALVLYFIVFGYTKSAEAIPYIVDNLQFIHDKNDFRLGWNIAYPALNAAEKITNITNESINTDAFYRADFADKRREIINKLREWYEEYKKSAGQKKK